MYPAGTVVGALPAGTVAGELPAGTDGGELAAGVVVDAVPDRGPAPVEVLKGLLELPGTGTDWDGYPGAE